MLPPVTAPALPAIIRNSHKVAIAALEKLSFRMEDREFFYTEFGPSSVDFEVRFWIRAERQTDYLSARSTAMKTLKSAFDEAGITIPFPIRTLDFDVVGGERLAEALAPVFSETVNGTPARQRT